MNKTKLDKLKEDLSKWKQEGYEVSDVERLVEFAIKQDKPKQVKHLALAIFISILLSSVVVLGSVPLALSGGEVANEALGSSFTYHKYEYGFPFKWISIEYTNEGSRNYIDYISTNFLGGFVNFFMFLFLFLLIYIVPVYSFRFYKGYKMLKSEHEKKG